VILAVDCGSTNHKVALYDAQLNRLAVCSTPVVYAVRDAARVEFDAAKIWQDTVELIRRACARAEITPAQIGTVSIASQAQTFTLLDANGRPLMPFISWMDKRAEAQSAELARRFGGVFHRHCSFATPLPQLQLSKLLWLRERHAGEFGPAAKIVTLPAYLALRLAGVHATDRNLAAMNGLYSLALSDWWPEALETAEVRREQIGELVNAGDAVVARRACAEFGFAPRLKIVFAGNDQTAGAYANASRSGQLVLTLGTALVVYRYAGETPGPYQRGGCWGPYPGGGFYELATRDEGCAALDWAVSRLMPGDESGFMERAETAPPGAAMFFPQRMHTDAAWSGPADVAARARAVLEGICFSARQLIEDDLRVPPGGKPVVVIGGGSRNRFWLQIAANVLNCPVRRGEGDILLGAAMIARPDVTPSLRAGEAVVTPEPAAVAVYERVYRDWVPQATVFEAGRHG
jgi:xylulokinase